MQFIYDLLSKAIGTAAGSYMTKLKSKTAKWKTLSTKATKYIKNTCKGCVKFIFGKPSSKKDYIHVSEWLVSKRFLLKTLLIGILAVFLCTNYIYPYLNGRLWPAKLVVNTSAFHEFTGEAIVYEENGDVLYKGNLESGLPTGVGEVYSGENLVYQGDIENNVFSGSGKLYEDGALLYEGAFASNVYNGAGVLYYADGKKQFEGDFVNGYPSFGTGYYKSGAKEYSGTLVDGKYEGYITIYEDTADNDIMYQGEMNNGYKNGIGTEYADGNMVYTGSFVYDVYQGDGELYADNRLLYKGNFSNGLYELDGKLYDETTGRLVYEGAFIQGKKEGLGILYSASGIPYYTGAFYNDAIDYVQFFNATSDVVETAFGKDYTTEIFENSFYLAYASKNLIFEFHFSKDNAQPKLSNIKVLGEQEVFGMENGITMEEMKGLFDDAIYSAYPVWVEENEAFVLQTIGDYETEELYAIKYNFADYYIRAYAYSETDKIVYYEMGGIS